MEREDIPTPPPPEQHNNPARRPIQLQAEGQAGATTVVGINLNLAFRHTTNARASPTVLAHPANDGGKSGGEEEKRERHYPERQRTITTFYTPPQPLTSRFFHPRRFQTSNGDHWMEVSHRVRCGVIRRMVYVDIRY